MHVSLQLPLDVDLSVCMLVIVVISHMLFAIRIAIDTVLVDEGEGKTRMA